MRPDPAIHLHLDEAHDLCHLLGQFEDWLLHTNDAVLDDLAGFLSATGWHHPTAAHAVIDALGDAGVLLTRRLRHAHPDQEVAW